MQHPYLQLSRRGFLRTTARGAVGGLAALSLPSFVRPARAAATAASVPGVSRAALIPGDSRANNVFSALKLIEDQIRAGIARKKRVIVKPNMVVVNKQLAASHAECLEAILEFLKPIVKDQILLGDSPAGGPVAEGFDNYGYTRLAKKYHVRLLDLDAEPTTVKHVIDEGHRPRPVRLVNLLLDPDTYIISSAVLKTHDRAVLTLSLKNIVVGAAIKDAGFRWGPGSQGSNDKTIIHGGPHNEGINYNLFQLAHILRPDLSVLDGYQGMEHNGPVAGTPVDHRVAVASTDWLAADRIGTELMGFDFAKVGYLSFCARAGLGQGDLSKIEVLGAKVADHIKHYRPHDTVEKQYEWMTRGSEK